MNQSGAYSKLCSLLSQPIECNSPSAKECVCASVLLNYGVRLRRPKKLFDASVMVDDSEIKMPYAQLSSSNQYQPSSFSQALSNMSSACNSSVCQAAEHAEHLVKKVLEEAENAEKVMRKVFTDAWNVCHFSALPQWLQDNDYLHMGHRPPLESFKACFWSVFRLHTETGNIWTHAFGCLLFLILAIYVLTCSPNYVQLTDKFVFGCFFAGAIICLGLSTCYHTLSCHSHKIGRLFSKLDYCGISLLITGSFVPWLYYGFYCHYFPKVFYIGLTIFLSIASVVVSLWDKFSEPHLRPLRAGVFMAFGLSGIIPGIHWLIWHGWSSWLEDSLRSSFTSLLLMGLLYISGALLYASRIPERFFPGKCDYWFHSHQLFHILVICAAIVHYHGISCMADYRLNSPTVCEIPLDTLTDKLTL